MKVIFDGQEVPIVSTKDMFSVPKGMRNLKKMNDEMGDRDTVIVSHPKYGFLVLELGIKQEGRPFVRLQHCPEDLSQKKIEVQP